MVEAATEFRKSGFNDEDSATLATVSSMFQNVADDAITAGDASSFIIAQMKAFNIEAENAQHIIDSVNEVSNKFAVSSSDLSNSLGIVSATMSQTGASFEETLGLMTAIVEVTRNSSKAARGLVSMGSRLTQMLDSQSATGKELLRIYKDLNIAVFDSNGQIRSSFDIWSDLAQVWGTLDKNTQNYISLTSAGANQIQNFSALMQNFSSASKATTAALDSTGSAARENTAYMESLEAKTNAVKESFQKLSNSIVDNDLVGLILDISKGLLDTANTPVGKFTLIATGITAITIATKALWDVMKIGPAIAALFTKGAIGMAGGLAALNPWMIAIVGGLSLLVTLAPQVIDLFKSIQDPLGTTTEKLEEANTQLQINEDRLKEINAIPWTDRTQDILDEKAALEEENEELQKSIDKLNEKKNTALGKAAKQEVDVYAGKQYMTPNITTDSGNLKYFSTYQEALDALIGKYGEVKVAEMGLADNIKEVDKVVNLSSDALNNKYISILGDLSTELKDTNKLEDESIELRDRNIANIKKQVDVYEQLKASGTDLTTSQQGLIDSYNKFTEAQDTATNRISDYVNGLIEEQVQAGKTGNAVYDLVSKEIIFNKTGLNVADKIAALAQLGTQAGATAAAIAAVMGIQSSDFNRTVSGLMEKSKGKLSLADAQAQVYKNIYSTMMKSVPSTTGAGLNLGGSSGTKTGGSTSKKSATDEALTRFQSLYKDIQHLRETGEIDDEEYYKRLKKNIADYTADATANMKKYGTDSKTIAQNMYQYQEELIKHTAEVEKAALEQRKTDLEKQKSDYETAFSYVSDLADKELKAAQDAYDAKAKEYDEEIQALQDQNSEIERQIALEEAQEAAAKARSSKVMVYKDGRYQYIQDTQAVSDAEANLEKLERDEALRQEVANLEESKKKALASLQDQIDYWEDYKKQWSSVVDNYQEEQNRLIAEQILGASLEGENWEKRLENLDAYVNRYIDTLKRLEQAQKQLENIEKIESIKSGISKENIEKIESIKSGISNKKWHEGINEGINVDADDREVDEDLGYDPNTDYSLALKDETLSDSERAELEAERQEKIDDLYGGKDPYKGYANGTLSASGGLSLVGDGGGPELRVLNPGDGIIPANVTKNLWAWGTTTPTAMMNSLSGFSGKSGNIMDITIQNLNLDQVHNGPEFVEYMKNNFWRTTIQQSTV